MAGHKLVLAVVFAKFLTLSIGLLSIPPSQLPSAIIILMIPFRMMAVFYLFGSGATVFYNYRNYQFKNNTKHTFQIHLWFSAKCLEGELRCSDDLPYRYHVIEENHAFIREANGLYFRRNEIWRICNEKGQIGGEISKELVTKNYACVAYVLQGFGDANPNF